MRRLPSLGPRGEGWLAAQLALILAVGVAPGFDPWRSAPAGPAGSLVAAAGWLLAIFGIAVATAAVYELRGRRAFSPLPLPRDDAELVESGPYALVRHPTYSGLLLTGLGWALAQGSPLALAADAALVAILYLKSAREEELLERRYPGYAAYRARTKRLIPGVL